MSKNADIVQSAQLQVGNRLYPDYRIQRNSEAFYFLKMLNSNAIFNNHTNSSNMKGNESLDLKFVIAFDRKTRNGHVASFTGLNVKHGEK